MSLVTCLLEVKLIFKLDLRTYVYEKNWPPTIFKLLIVLYKQKSYRDLNAVGNFKMSTGA